jgi:hypothetical protein
MKPLLERAGYSMLSIFYVLTRCHLSNRSRMQPKPPAVAAAMLLSLDDDTWLERLQDAGPKSWDQ